MSSSSAGQFSPNPLRSRNVTAVLGPTNTGKTHLAIERMLDHETGLIGLPLRLLAREVYDRVAARIGPEAVALITGEEKIKPSKPRYYVCTVEAMPRDIEVDFLAIDEVQLAADAERGHVFTDRLLHARGQQQTLLLGAGTMREAIKDLLPGANFISKPRLSKLSYSGQKKLSRLPARTAIVAFSASDVYEIAELIRRQRGGAAVVLGAQSPRTRNAQVQLYQSGEVEFLVATDAIGMGLNLDVGHVAFAGIRKFDGRVHRELLPAEVGQIAGRAGRHMSDGTFGVTGEVEPLESELIDRLEKHEFEPVRVLQWRSGSLDFSSLENLKESLRTAPEHARLTRARMADDLLALEAVSSDEDVRQLARSTAAIKRLWDVCQVPDYRKMSPQSHAELIGTLFKFVQSDDERIPEDWFANQVSLANRTDGDIDTLSTRISHIRTWTFVANRADWLERPDYWQGRTREIEDTLSDAMHEQLTQRFVDKRTSTLMKRMRDDEELTAEIGEDGAIKVENHFVGRITGFRFQPDMETSAEGIHGKAARHAAAQVLTKELDMRARRVSSAKSDALKLVRPSRIEWRGEEVARLERTDDPLKPNVVLLADEHLQPGDRERVQARLSEWFTQLIDERLKPLAELTKAEDVSGLARGIAFRLRENFGVLKRETIAEDLKQLDQQSRGQLRKYGVRFGAFNIYFPLLLKPSAAELLLSLWTLQRGDKDGSTHAPPRAGLTSVVTDRTVPEEFYRAAGYHVCGPRAVRLDMLERLADMIRPLVAWRADEAKPSAPPKGSTGDGGFTVIPEMMSILGCSSEELSEVLKALGFRLDRRPKPKPAAMPAPAAAGAEAVSAEVDAVRAADAISGEPASPLAAPREDGNAEPPALEAPADQTEAAPELAGGPSGDAVREPTVVASSEADASPAPATTAPGLTDSDSAVPAPAVEAPAVEPVAAAEPEFIEVWRPRKRRHDDGQQAHRGRRDRQGRHRGDRHGGGRQDRTPAAPPGEAAAAPTPEAAASAAPGEAPAAGQNPEQGGQDRRDWKQRRDRRDDRRDKREPGAKGSEPREGRPPRREDRGPPRHRDRDRRSEDRGRMQSGPETKRGGYDPNSPFAALGALKQALEQQRREPSSS